MKELDELYKAGELVEFAFAFEREYVEGDEAYKLQLLQFYLKYWNHAETIDFITDLLLQAHLVGTKKLTKLKGIIMTVKKAYVELIAFLEANSNKKVSTILEEAKAMCTAKSACGSDTGKTFIRDSDGEVVAIFCYYFKVWMPLCDVEFGAKKATASGYNTMCKSGVSNWSKQQRAASKATAELLAKIASGELKPADLEAEQVAIELARKAVVECTEVHFQTSAEVLAYLEQPADEVNTSTED